MLDTNVSRGMAKKTGEIQLSAKGRQVITLNLAITLRVTLVGDLVKSLFTLYIYTIFEKVFLYKTGYRVPFQTRLFSYKRFRHIIYVVSCLVVLDILELCDIFAGAGY